MSKHDKPEISKVPEHLRSEDNEGTQVAVDGRNEDTRISFHIHEGEFCIRFTLDREGFSALIVAGYQALSEVIDRDDEWKTPDVGPDQSDGYLH